MAARSSAPVIGALCSNDHEHVAADWITRGADKWYSPHHWTLSIGYRNQNSFRHYVGTTEQVQREIQQTAVRNWIHLFDVSLTYEVSPRWSITGSVPVMHATRLYDHQLFQTLLHQPNAPDQYSHSTGFGDVGVSAQVWLLRPPSEHGRNIAFSFGGTFPTGDSHVQDTVPTIFGPRTIFVDQSIQLGSGGYGISLGTQMFQRVNRFVLYASGTYLLTPQKQNDVVNASLGGRDPRPYAQNPWTYYMSIPDQYLADGGVAMAVPKTRGLAVKFGLRYEGVKVKDIFGSSLGFRRPGYALSVEPGLQYESGKNIYTFNIPWAVQRNRKRSVPDQTTGGAGDAAFADHLLLIGYTRRF